MYIVRIDFIDIYGNVETFDNVGIFDSKAQAKAWGMSHFSIVKRTLLANYGIEETELSGITMSVEKVNSVFEYSL